MVENTASTLVNFRKLINILPTQHIEEFTLRICDNLIATYFLL